MKYKRILLIKEDKKNFVAIDKDKLLNISEARIMVNSSLCSIANVETEYLALDGKAIKLDKDYDYALGENEYDELFLIILKK